MHSQKIPVYLGHLYEVEFIFLVFLLVFSFHWQDFGYVQTTSTEILKSYIFNEPIMIDAGRLPPLGPAAMFMVFYKLGNVAFKGQDRILIFFIFILFTVVPSAYAIDFVKCSKEPKECQGQQLLNL